MPPLEIAAWVIGAVGLAGVAWAFFKSDSLRVRLAALGGFGVVYLGIIAFGWASIEWFNATTIGVAAIALLSRMRAPLPGKPGSEAEPADEDADAEPVAVTDGADAQPLADDAIEVSPKPAEESQPPA